MSEHPQEAIEAVAQALWVATGWPPSIWEIQTEALKDGWRERAIALLDQIAPLYREQAAQMTEQIPHMRAAWVAAAIRKGE